MILTVHGTAENLDLVRLQAMSGADPEHPHIHIVDMPYRLTSTWQDRGCRLAIWQEGEEIWAWAVFQPPWWNLDYAVHPSQRGASLEREVLAWGKGQMTEYAQHARVVFSGSVEIFEDTPDAEGTMEYLASLGFERFDWSIIRFEKELDQELARPRLPHGLSLRPFRGCAEIRAYVELHRAAFGSDAMTTAWRGRTLEHAAYRPDIDLVAVDRADRCVGFCVCWMWQGVGQIEPMGVHPDYQGHGLGRALELAAMHALRRAGARLVHVDHVSTNEVAIALSLKAGFRQVHNAVRYFAEVGIGET